MHNVEVVSWKYIWLFPVDGPVMVVSGVRKGRHIPVAPFTNMVLTLIPAWLSNHMHSLVWDEIIYPFLNFNGTVAPLKFRNG